MAIKWLYKFNESSLWTLIDYSWWGFHGTDNWTAWVLSWWFYWKVRQFPWWWSNQISLNTWNISTWSSDRTIIVWAKHYSLTWNPSTVYSAWSDAAWQLLEMVAYADSWNWNVAAMVIWRNTDDAFVRSSSLVPKNNVWNMWAFRYISTNPSYYCNDRFMDIIPSTLWILNTSWSAHNFWYAIRNSGFGIWKMYWEISKAILFNNWLSNAQLKNEYAHMKWFI